MFEAKHELEPLPRKARDMMLWRIDRPRTENDQFCTVKRYNFQLGEFTGQLFMVYDEDIWEACWGDALRAYVIGEQGSGGALDIHVTLCPVFEEDLSQYTDQNAIHDFHQMVANN